MTVTEPNNYLYDENGNALVPENLLKGFFITPPEVHLDKERDVLQFPVPQQDQEGKISLTFSNDHNFSYAEIVNEFAFAGWKYKEPEFDQTKLLEEILKLHDAAQEYILKFAKKWGPLWKCIKHKKCFMNTDFFKEEGQCLWCPEERIEDYRILSRMMRAIVNSKSDEMVEFIKSMGEDYFPEECDFEKRTFNIIKELPDVSDGLMVILFSIFFQINHLTICMDWGPNKEDETEKHKHKHGSVPLVEFNTGLGYVRIAMLALSHKMWGTKELVVCSKCHEPYFRMKRNARKGQKNYCPDCRK